MRLRLFDLNAQWMKSLNNHLDIWYIAMLREFGINTRTISINFNFLIIVSFFTIFFYENQTCFIHHRIIVYHNLTFLTCLCIVYLCVVNHHDQKSFAVLVFPYLKIVALANARNTFSMEKNEKLFDVNCSINSTLSL